MSTINLSKSSKNWLHYALNRLARTASIANAAFSLATPIDSTHHVLSAHAHNLPQQVGKGRQLQALQLSGSHLYHYTKVAFVRVCVCVCLFTSGK
jgi:hypothetical protein